ncbi:MAG: YhcH/YjgK/YiaL family protein [Bacteroidetes bacterium]|nr:YhcH/YjgK/YiaL family protein [Bacteroidota bacterium]
MVIDHLRNAVKYYPISPYVAKGLLWIEKHKNELATMENGRYEIQGEDVYAIVNSYDTKPAAECGWEAHKVYCDIHYSVTGEECIAYAHISGMKETQPYNAERDYSLYEGEGDRMTMREGMFSLLMPEDVHAPGAMTGSTPTFLKKVVIKLRA